MLYNNFLYYGFVPMIPNDKFFQPPSLYELMNSLANFNSETKTKIRDLPLATHERIFDFDYPLSNKVDKTTFETLILKKFIRRRIGQETFTAFQLALDSKLNEIMPYYNKLFDSFVDWNLFNDGESGEKSSTNNLVKDSTTSKENNATRETDITAETDNRYSKLPQNEISNVKNGTYMTDYTLNQSNSNGTDTSEMTENTSENNEENTIYNETYRKNNSNKIQTYLDFIENRNKIMTLIYEDLDELFYGIANTN